MPEYSIFLKLLESQSCISRTNFHTCIHPFRLGLNRKFSLRFFSCHVFIEIQKKIFTLKKLYIISVCGCKSTCFHPSVWCVVILVSPLFSILAPHALNAVFPFSMDLTIYKQLSGTNRRFESDLTISIPCVPYFLCVQYLTAMLPWLSFLQLSF